MDKNTKEKDIKFQHLNNHTSEVTKWDNFQCFLENGLFKNYI